MKLPASTAAENHPWVVDDERASSPRFGALFGGAKACAASAPGAFAAWLLAPVGLSEFERAVLTKRPLAVRRSDRGYYDGLFSTESIDRALRARALRYTSELDLATYTEEEGRRTLNPTAGPDEEFPVAAAADVWAAHAAGASVRLSWPQRVDEALWTACHLLDEQWGGASGANAYLTPAGGRAGFAPHWDDVDVFIAQLEGTKQWTVHAPAQLHPRASSGNLEPAELPPAVLQCELRPGDLLYLPRGWIHHARTPEPSAVPPAGAARGSLHVTLSTGRAETWADLAECLLQLALPAVAEQHAGLRANLPRGWERFMGLQHADADAGGRDGGEEGEGEGGEARGAVGRRRALFRAKCESMLSQWAAAALAQLDAAADELAARHVWDRLPPPPPPGGRVGAWRAPAAEGWAEASAQGAAEAAHVSLTSRLRLRCRGCARLSSDGEVAILHHSLANSRAFHALDAPEQVCFALPAAPALEAVLAAYPRAIAVAALPVGPADDEDDGADDDEDGEAAAAADDAVRLDVARALVEAGVVLHQRGGDITRLPTPKSPQPQPQQQDGKQQPRQRGAQSEAAELDGAAGASGGESGGGKKRKRGGVTKAEKRARAAAASGAL